MLDNGVIYNGIFGDLKSHVLTGCESGPAIR